MLTALQIGRLKGHTKYATIVQKGELPSVKISVRQTRKCIDNGWRYGGYRWHFTTEKIGGRLVLEVECMLKK